MYNSDNVMNTDAQTAEAREAARLKARTQLLSTFTMDELRYERTRRAKLEGAKRDLPAALELVERAQEAVKALREIIESDGVKDVAYDRTSVLYRA